MPSVFLFTYSGSNYYLFWPAAGKEGSNFYLAGKEGSNSYLAGKEGGNSYLAVTQMLSQKSIGNPKGNELNPQNFAPAAV